MFREAKAVAVLSLAFGMAPVFASRITTIRVDAAPMRPVGWPYGQGRRAAQKPHPQRVLLDKSIASLPARYSKATSTEAARLWTNVAVQYVALAQRKESETILGGISFTDVLSALPPPPSWPAIANYVRQDKIVTSGTIEGRSLYIISLLLINDRKAQKVAIDKLQQQLTGHKDDPMYDGARRQLGALAAEYAEHREPSSRQAVEYILKTQLNTKRGQTGRVSLPDLVTLLGPEQAETVLRRVLRTRNTVAISRGAATYKLAQRLALAMIDELQVPQWSLTHRLDRKSVV